jgi:hypothetical protein
MILVDTPCFDCMVPQSIQPARDRRPLGIHKIFQDVKLPWLGGRRKWGVASTGFSGLGELDLTRRAHQLPGQVHLNSARYSVRLQPQSMFGQVRTANNVRCCVGRVDRHISHSKVYKSWERHVGNSRMEVLEMNLNVESCPSVNQWLRYGVAS